MPQPAKSKLTLSEVTPKKPADMSSWERRKLYWKNLSMSSTSMNPVSNTSTVRQESLQSENASKKPNNKPLPVASAKDLTKLSPKVNAKATGVKASSKPGAKGISGQGKMGKTAARMSFKPSAAPVRRATLAMTTSRPAIFPNRRLTMASSKPVPPMKGILTTLVALPQIAQQPIIPPEPPKNTRKRYHDVPSRIFSGIKKRQLEISAVSHSAPCKIYTKPSTTVPKTAVNARRSLYAVGKRSRPSTSVGFSQAILFSSNAGPSIASNSPRTLRRGSFTVKSVSTRKNIAVSSKPHDSKKSKPVVSEPVVAVGRTTRGGKESTCTLEQKDVVESGGKSLPLTAKPPISGKLSKKKRRMTLVNEDLEPEQVSFSAGLLLVNETKIETIVSSQEQITPAEFEISNDTGYPWATNTNYYDNLGNTPRPIRRGSFTINRVNLQEEMMKKSDDPIVAGIESQHVTPNKSNCNASVLISNTTLNKSINKTKTPIKSALRKSTRSSRGLQFKDSLELSNAENLPPYRESALEEGVTSLKCSKSVSFMVSSGGKKLTKTLPKTPRRELSIRQKMEKFLEEKDSNVSKLRHLHCFGFQLSDMKKKGLGPRLSSPGSSGPTSVLSSPSLKDRMSKRTHLHPTQTSTVPESPMLQVNSILSDLKTLLIMGETVEQGEEWLLELENQAFEMLQGKACYWVVKALLAERAGRFQDAWYIFSQAVDRDVQPHEELTSALNEFASRVPPAMAQEAAHINDQELPFATADETLLNVKETSVSSSTKSSRKKKGSSKDQQSSQRKKKTPAKNYQEVFESTVIKYTMRNSKALQNLNKILNLGTPTVAAVLTPVRRSARLTRSSAKKLRRSFNADDLPEALKERVLNVPNDFL